MNTTAENATKSLIDFIKKTPTAFHAVKNITEILTEHGALPFDEASDVELLRGKTYYVTRSMSSVIAFRVPEKPKAFMMCATHTDSPCFKLKPEFEKKSAGRLITLDVEKYGGMIHSSWLDRPLSVAGRIALKTENGISMKTVMLDRDLLVIPNMCIHFNRSVNDGYKYNSQNDLSPLFAQGTEHTSLMQLIANELCVNDSDIISHDLYLYDRTPGTLWGANNEFFSSPRIDNLQCAYATLMGFLSSPLKDCIQIYASFDNEETGSSSKQGAASTFLSDTLERICEKTGISRHEFHRMLSSSFMISADNAHALHPTHPELYDSLNAPEMNGGIVIKTNANQKYTTDAVSSSIFTTICERAAVPVQMFANRSDIMGGSTLGNISNTRVALNTVDIGLAQLAMHSAWESAGVFDTLHLIHCIEEFYKTHITCLKDGEYIIE